MKIEQEKSANKKIKVLHIITRMIVGGAQENTLLTVLGLAKDPNFSVALLTGPSYGPEGRLLKNRPKGVKMIYLHQLCREISPVRDLVALIKMVKIIREGGYEIIHTHTSKAGIIGRVAAFLAGAPICVHTIHGLPFHPYEKWYKNLLYRGLEATVAPLTDKIVTVADSMATQAQAAGVGAKGKFITIRSGMDTALFAEKKPIFRDGKLINRKSLGISDKAFLFVKVARLFDLKGHDFVLKAAHLLKDKYPDLCILFAGDGILREKYEKMVDELGLKGRIFFAGLVPPSDISGYFHLSDALIHASLREGLARVLPQAFLAGLPVISFDVDGAKEVVKPKRTGFLLPAEDWRGLACAMAEIMDDPKRAKRMARRGKKLCLGLYPTERMVERIKQLYLDLRQKKEKS